MNTVAALATGTHPHAKHTARQDNNLDRICPYGFPQYIPNLNGIRRWYDFVQRGKSFAKHDRAGKRVSTSQRCRGLSVPIIAAVQWSCKFILVAVGPDLGIASAQLLAP
jgi:hypothetical protein